MSNLRTIKKRASIPAALVAVIAMVMSVLLVPFQEATAQTTGERDKFFGTCGGSVAISFDLSNSLSPTDVENSKKAVRQLVESLKGAPYRFGIYTFASQSPARGNENNEIVAESLVTTEGYNKVLNAINSIQMPGILEKNSSSPNGGTNWEAGLKSIADDIDLGAKYDTVYFITDGQPTWNNQGRNWSGSTTETTELDSAVAQAKRITEAGAKLVPIGVGDISKNNSIELYALKDGWWHGIRTKLWQIDRTYTGRQMLEKLTTPDTKPIILDNYDLLPDLMGEQLFTGCFQVAKSVIDENGKVIDSPADWNFDIDAKGTPNIPKKLTTDKNGQANFQIKTLDRVDFDITITEKPTSEQDGKFRFKDARCMRYSYNKKPEPVRADLKGKSLTLHADSKSWISCTFDNLPVVPVSVKKNVVVNSQVLNSELNDATFDFNYRCRKGPQQEEVSGVVTGVRNGEEQTFANVAVGTECEVQEVPSNVDKSRIDLSTTWSAVNAAPGTREQDGVFKFIAGGEAHKKSVAVTAIAQNDYKAKNAKIVLTKKIANEKDIPEDKIPAAFPVRYSCRYVPNREQVLKPGIILGGVGEFVESKTVSVPRNGSTEIGPFPVGTHCSLEETADPDSEIKDSAAIPGFSLENSWKSDICAAGDQGSMRECGTNYIWVPSEGKHNVEVNNTYTREKATLELTKSVEGDGADLTNEYSFSFDVTCRDGGKEVYTHKNLEVRKGDKAILEDVPVATDCEVTEKTPEIPGLIFELRKSMSFRAQHKDETVRVPFLNIATRVKVPITVKKIVKVEQEQIIDPEVLEKIRGLDYHISAHCTQPDGKEITPTIPPAKDEQTVNLGEYPIGTTCDLSEDTQELTGVQMSYEFTGGPQIAINDVNPVEKTLTNTFSPATGELKITKKVLDEEIPQAVRGLLPTKFDVDVWCTSSGSHPVELTDNQTAVVTNVVVGETCVLSESTPDIQGFRHTVQWRGSSTESKDNSISIKIHADQGNVYRLENSYSLDNVRLTLKKTVRVLDKEGKEVPEKLRYAVVPSDQSFPMNYRCELGGNEVVENTKMVHTGNGTDVFVPRGSNCVVKEEPLALNLNAVSDPKVEYRGGTNAQADSVSATIGDGENSVEVVNTFNLKTGSFNLKKKVDGEGVSTVGGDRKFDLSYTCRLGLWEKKGTVQLGRFDKGEDHKITDIPLGASCTVTENKGTAQEPNAKVTARWTHVDSASGRDDKETSCDNASECSPVPDDQFSTTVTIADDKPNDFQGTFVVWNTYTYDKVPVQVDKIRSGDGQDLAAKETFAFTLVCTDPKFKDSDLANREGFKPSTVDATLTVTGQGRAKNTVADKTADVVEVPVGYDCEITENPISLYDATVTTKFSSPGVDPATARPRVAGESVSAKFKADKQPGDAPLLVQVDNNYVRPRAEVLVSKEIAKAGDSVHQWLPNSTYHITYVCTDPYSDRSSYAGYVDVQADAAEPARILADPTTGLKLPASATCEFREDTEGHVPPEAQNLVEEINKVTEFSGKEEKRSTFTADMKDVALSATEPTHIKFTNSYTIPMQSYTLQKFVEGDPGRKVIADGATFRFNYTCTLPYVFPNQPNPISGEVGNKVASGVIDLHEGQLWRFPDLPRTTSCTIKEEDDPTLRTNLENNALRMVPTYLFPTERAGAASAASAPEIPPSTGRPIYNGTEPRHQMPESGIELNDAHSHTVVINNVYTTDAEINIAKVNADNSPLPGAHFAIYGIGENGQRNELAEVADVPAQSVEQALFAVRLRPGSYELVETQAPQGAQLLPKPWRFDVKAANAGAMGDLEVTLDNYDADSGLITVEHPQGKPWLIKVANVSAATLPLTGSNGYLRWLLAGAAGLLVAAALWLVARRKR